MFERHKKKLQWGLLLVVVLGLAAYAIYTQVISVVPFDDQYDPEMAYFMNGLGLLDGFRYYYVDHPGTPVNLATTLLLLVFKPVVALQGHTDFSTYMLLHPGQFLLVARLLVSLLNITAVVYIWRFSKDKVSFAGLVLILTGYFVVLGAGFWSMTALWSHNAFCFSLGTVFLFIIYQTISTGRWRSYRRLAWLGAGAGFLLSIQLYFLAWVIGLLAVVICLLLIEKRPWWIMIRFVSAITGGIVAGFIVVNLPILLTYMIGWFQSVTKNLGRYGSGDPGIISLSLLWQNFVAYLQDGFGLLFGLVIVLLVGFVVWAFRRRDFAAHKALWAAAGGFGGQTLLVCLLVLKHPGENYLVAVASMLPMLFFIWFNLPQPDHKLWTGSLVAIACVFLIMFSGQFVDAVRFNDQAKNYQAARVALVDEQLTEYAAQQSTTREALQVFAGYRVVFDWCEPLWFGNFWANNIYTDALNQFCGHENRFDVWLNFFSVNGTNVAFDAYDDWDVIILQSDYWDAVEFFQDRDFMVQNLDYDLTFVTH